jgi:probable DNA repair protein
MFLQDALDRGAVVLTANLRAARALEAAYAEDQRSRCILAWPRPRILDWNSWVAGLWEKYARHAENAPMPLSALQEQQLWKQVQGADRDRVVAPDRMAELAQEAYGLLGSYRAHSLRVDAATSGEAHEDAERFLHWAASFDRLCAQNGWIPRTRLEETLSRHAGLLNDAPELCLVGFDRTTPAQTALLQAVEAAGTRVLRYAEAPQSTRPVLMRARHQREELEACAWWCRDQIAEGSPRRIGVIAPDLGHVRAELDRVFRRILMPQTTLWASAGPDPALPYEFSLGASLATLPVIRAALLLLHWLTAPLAAAELTWLLTSGFLAASAADQLSLARLDAELRRSNSSPEVSLAWLLDRPRRNLPADLRARLVRVQMRAGALRAAPPSGVGDGPKDRRASWAFWAELAPSLPAETGWPGFRETDSLAFQAQQRWMRLLGELAELGFDGSQPTWSDFRRTLETQAHAVLFAAESTAPPIQVLGAFESSGQTFDAVWFLGADDEHWPAAGRPHPLLPAWLQREAKMPHASPDADWLLAQEATARIVASAPSVVLSYPMQDSTSQGVALRVSPLLLAYGTDAVATPIKAAPALPPVQLESVADDSGGLPWPAEQSAGGAEILKRQAACAFQSFAMQRLKARPLEQAEQGLDAAERGTMLHSVLQQLWSTDAGSTDPLRPHTYEDIRRAMADGSVTAMLAHHIDAVFAPLLSAQPDPWSNAYLACEQKRVHDRLLAWLVCELERRPFTVVALEKEVAALVGNLRLSLRIDRVDKLADGTSLLIDYKTGLVKAGAWVGARPEEPQLPLYALFGGIDNVSGVAFAQIRAEETKLIARAADPAAMVSEKLGAVSEQNRFDDEIRDGWQQALDGLAAQFVRGEASVNPRDGAKTCKYCPLTGLCRVHASPSLLEQDDAHEHE